MHRPPEPIDSYVIRQLAYLTSNLSTFSRTACAPPHFARHELCFVMRVMLAPTRTSSRGPEHMGYKGRESRKKEYMGDRVQQEDAAAILNTKRRVTSEGAVGSPPSHLNVHRRTYYRRHQPLLEEMTPDIRAPRLERALEGWEIDQRKDLPPSQRPR